MGMMTEFKEFAMRGNVIDLAVGVVIGAAFGKIVASFVDGIVMPLLGMLTGGVDFSDRVIVLRDAVLGDRLAATGWFDRATLQQLVDGHLAGTSDHSAPLWTLLMFEAFLRNVVDAPAQRDRVAPERVAA